MLDAFDANSQSTRMNKGYHNCPNCGELWRRVEDLEKKIKSYEFYKIGFWISTTLVLVNGIVILMRTPF
jgi:uncharacterized C2H2 Zn-finger protein